MEVNGDKWDHLLKIKTSGRDDSRSDYYHYPYEPTPYRVLERLSASGYIGKKNCLLDYGCGKGRVSLFLSYQTRCKSLGLDFNENLVKRAVKNTESGVSGSRCTFLVSAAERFQVPVEVDRCFFFNPFNLQIFESVLKRLKESLLEKDRELLLFFYYPSAEYSALIGERDDLCLVDEISCEDLFAGSNERERILVVNLRSDFV